MFDSGPYFENNQSVTYEFNQAFNPVQHFDVTPEIRSDKSREKPQTHGVYPTPTYRGGMSIEVQGAILADTYTDYNTKRLALVADLFGTNFDSLVSEVQMGMLRLIVTGQSEHWEVPVMVDAFTAAKEWNEGAYSQFMVTFYAFQPYFTGVTTPTNKYRWS